MITSRRFNVAVLPGDGIGPEVMGEVRRVIDWMDRRRAVTFDVGEGLDAAERHRQTVRAEKAHRATGYRFA